jgi:flavin reductase (DIM6/NTAB) family NADH-FMN oxidoreductase RutF
MFAANENTLEKRKDTMVNVERTGELVYNMATYELREAVNKLAAQVMPEVDEFVLAGSTKALSTKIGPARVAESSVQFGCVHFQTIRIPGKGTWHPWMS